MTGSRRLLGGILLVVLGLSTAGIMLSIIMRGEAPRLERVGAEEAGESFKDSFSLGLGAEILFNLSVAVINDGGNVIVANNSLARVKIVGFEWPNFIVELSELTATGSSGRTFNVEFPFPIIALPESMIGSSTITVPVYFIPLVDGVCMALTMVNNAGGVLRYEGKLNLYRGTIEAVAGYEASGLISFMELRLVERGKTLIVNLSKINVSVGGGDRLDVEVPKSWFCGNGYSSNLNFVATGSIVIEDGRVSPVSLDEVRAAIRGDALLAVLWKECPHCHRMWPDILRASELVDIPIYAILIGPTATGGGLMARDELQFILNEMSKAGVRGTPAFIVYHEGKPTNVVEGAMPLEEFISWIKSATASHT